MFRKGRAQEGVSVPGYGAPCARVCLRQGQEVQCQYMVATWVSVRGYLVYQGISACQALEAPSWGLSAREWLAITQKWLALFSPDLSIRRALAREYSPTCQA